ncbi:MAG: hypothetical protein LBH43_18675 [Treponema sp.]|jgi:hypothetical protein|nr:hypothetical protein [Treponema sp.]
MSENWFNTSPQSFTGIVHFFDMLFKIIKTNFIAASSLGEGPAGFQVTLKRIFYGLNGVCRINGLADFR